MYNQSFQQFGAPVGDVNNLAVVGRASNGRKKIAVVVIVILLLIGAVVGGVVLMLKQQQETISVDRQVYELAYDNFEDITGVQRVFIRLRDGHYSSVGLFSEHFHDYLNEMGATMSSFYQKVSKINSSKITVQLAKENFELLRTSLDTNISAYTDTVSLYNQYYESNDSDDESDEMMLEIFTKYTNDESFTDVYYYDVLGYLIAELQNAE